GARYVIFELQHRWFLYKCYRWSVKYFFDIRPQMRPLFVQKVAMKAAFRRSSHQKASTSLQRPRQQLRPCEFLAGAPQPECQPPSRRYTDLARNPHWHASHSGLSMEQNLASSTGAASDDADIAPAPDSPPSAGTAFSWPPRTVDFSVDVAPRVRR